MLLRHKDNKQPLGAFTKMSYEVQTETYSVFNGGIGGHGNRHVRPNTQGAEQTIH